MNYSERKLFCAQPLCLFLYWHQMALLFQMFYLCLACTYVEHTEGKLTNVKIYITHLYFKAKMDMIHLNPYKPYGNVEIPRH